MRKNIITGGAGFIGINMADYLASAGHNVVIIDNMSRKGAKENIDWILQKHPSVRIVVADISRDFDVLKSEINDGVDVVYHFAGQVAVTTSVVNPRLDFEINALGSFNVLEAARLAKSPPVLFYSSTNKVYGGMEDVGVMDSGVAYAYENLPNGIHESNNLDFHSPYGCSKGAADQYFHDYARIYGLKTVVFRQSCIYGTRQFGIEDQGWVAWFTIAALLKKEITIYGDGKQVRDVLYVGDLIDAYELALENINVTAGKIYNVGGGPENSLSLLSLLRILEEQLMHVVPHQFSEWRPGDQKVYISNIDKALSDFGWKPRTTPEDGVKVLTQWVLDHRNLLNQLFV
jgi:CDP-paratose 2-epimerase